MRSILALAVLGTAIPSLAAPQFDLGALLGLPSSSLEPGASNSGPTTADRAECFALEWIHGRGTTEPASLGSRLGPNLKNQLVQRLGNRVNVIGLVFPASFQLPQSPQTGVNNLVARIRQRSQQCPDMLFGISGYSQGADIAHGAIQLLPDYADRILALAMFGDPLTAIGWPAAYADRVINTCDPADQACGGRGTSGHMLYGAEDNVLHVVAAQYITAKFLAGKPAPAAGAKTLKALPQLGDSAKFLTDRSWPPANWKSKYPDGTVVKPIGLTGTDRQSVTAALANFDFKLDTSLAGSVIPPGAAQ
ncbi:alpha/beta-hydrolase [Eremomyces bilateralis CBS 781.70]|uniref:Alpha/beta-hydrolase n=1 Tax=Eremomyces bilateralis CBS 781.70 TaxID=1392243 RepID=A0A6G1GD65_9PEZI|nr:alpha/beta-hydrolase [Eremomyces bilateralis CBS 781.70]KAF1815809.1 alpha/beta-hydrolase [Eremomyces bilateralis CBS 781.70]